MLTPENILQSKLRVFWAIRKGENDTSSPSPSSPSDLHFEKLIAFSSQDQYQSILQATVANLLKAAVLMSCVARYLQGEDHVQGPHLLYICRGSSLAGWAAPEDHWKQVFCHVQNDSFLILAPS